MTKQIPLTKGKFALVDDEDYEYLMQWKWRVDVGGYAVREQHVSGGKKNEIRHMVQMHRVINKTPDGLKTDHIDGDKLNNVRGNLRNATPSQNKANAGPYKNNKSGFKGVSWSRLNKKWVAQIKVAGRRIHLGYHRDIKAAVRAYNTAAVKFFGQFAKLNKSEGV